MYTAGKLKAELRGPPLQLALREICTGQETQACKSRVLHLLRAFPGTVQAQASAGREYSLAASTAPPPSELTNPPVWMQLAENGSGESHHALSFCQVFTLSEVPGRIPGSYFWGSHSTVLRSGSTEEKFASMLPSSESPTAGHSTQNCSCIGTQDSGFSFLGK